MRLRELASKRRMHKFFREITKDAVVYDGSHKAHYLFTGNLPMDEILPLTNLKPPPNAFYYFYCYTGVKRHEWLMWAGVGKEKLDGYLVIYNWYVKPPDIVEALGEDSRRNSSGVSWCEPDWGAYIPVDKNMSPQMQRTYQINVMPAFKENIERCERHSLKRFREQADIQFGLLMWMLDSHNKEAASVGG
jgi:hypothetical protein